LHNTLFCTSLNLLYDEGSMKHLFLLVMHNNTFHIHFCTFIRLNFSTFGFVEISHVKNGRFSENKKLTNVK